MPAHNDKKFSDQELMDAMSYPGFSCLGFAKQIGCHESSVRARRDKLVRQGWSPEHKYTHIVPDGFIVKGVSQQYKSDGTLGQQWVKSKVDAERQLEILREGLKAFMDDLPKVPEIFLKNDVDRKDDLMVVFPIGDLHVGMMAWKDESGNDWSLKHVEAAVQLVFKELVDKAPTCKRAVIINLGDFGHRDGKNAVTPNSGHQLDVDSRYPKMVRMCLRLKRYLIELMLTKFEEVEDYNVTGNHDPALSVMIAEALYNIYENNPRIKIDISPKPVKYIEWGKTMIATTHGDTIKWDRFSQVVATDECELWGRTKFRYGLTGHIHSENKKEFPGMVCESFRTLAAADSFAAWFGWRSGRDSRFIVYDKTLGKKAEHIEPIDMCQEILDQIS